jgi:hypothetical protein
MEARRYSDQHDHSEYVLTKKGLDLQPVIIALPLGAIAGPPPKGHPSCTSTKAAADASASNSVARSAGQYQGPSRSKRGQALVVLRPTRQRRRSCERRDRLRLFQRSRKRAPKGLEDHLAVIEQLRELKPVKIVEVVAAWSPTRATSAREVKASVKALQSSSVTTACGLLIEQVGRKPLNVTPLRAVFYIFHKHGGILHSWIDFAITALIARNAIKHRVIRRPLLPLLPFPSDWCTFGNPRWDHRMLQPRKGVERCQEAAAGAFGAASEYSSLVRQDVFQAALEGRSDSKHSGVMKRPLPAGKALANVMLPSPPCESLCAGVHCGD